MTAAARALALSALCALAAACGSPPPPAATTTVSTTSTIDADLLDVSVPQLQAFYAARTYTVTQVVQWHLARSAKYNGIYRAIETGLEQDALALAARLDAAAGAPPGGWAAARRCCWWSQSGYCAFAASFETPPPPRHGCGMKWRKLRAC